MNAIEFLSFQPWVERLAWTLLHFLWQGALIAALYATVRAWMARSSPDGRYVLGCAALTAMLAMPFVTLSLTYRSGLVPVSSHSTVRMAAASANPAASSTLPESVRARVSAVRPEQFLAWVVMLWLIGVVTFWVRLVGGWAVVARMRSTQVRAAPEWQQTLKEISIRIGVSRPVQLLISAVVEAPTVIGWLRPVVLMPVGSLAGLPAEHVEALLAHELAHIRRHDYLVNILQSVVEALLFYHPAVWWVSRHIRTERELCCDDVAVSLNGDALAYALALAELESFRPAHLNAAVAANGGSLADRIARLLGQSRPVSGTLPGPVVMLSATLLIVMAWGMFGQSAALPRFDVASIKPDSPGGANTGEVQILPGGRLRAEKAVLRYFIQASYSLKSFQLLGGPDWINSVGYDIEARAEGSPGRGQMHLMMQALLADRFHLTAHRETRNLPVYILTVAKSGLKLQPLKEGSCVASNPGAPIVPPAPDQLPVCGIARFWISIPTVRMQGGKVNMAELARSFSNVLGVTVIDRTGFTGTFDVHLEFGFDDALEGLPHPGPMPPADNGAPSIFSAIQEQLGLKLESGKGPVEVLVIDHVERPAQN